MLHLGNGGWIEGGEYLIPDEQQGLVMGGSVTLRARIKGGERSSTHAAFDPSSQPVAADEADVEEVSARFSRLRRPADAVPLSDELQRKLRSLGYNLGKKGR